MICEGIVLFRIQHFQKGTGRISGIIFGKLIHFIQDHHRIHDSGPLHALHDPARHRSHIGSSVTTDLSLITNTAQADPDTFSPKSSGNALADAGFTRTGSSHKKQDGTGLLLIQRHDCKLLDDPFFHLTKPVVILIQYFFCLVQIDLGSRFLLPGKGSHKVQILIMDPILMALLSLLFHSVQDLFRFFSGFSAHTGSFDLLFKATHIGNIFRMHIIKLLLQKFDLFFQSGLPIKTVMVLFLGIFRLHAYPVHLNCLPDGFFDELAAFFSGIRLQDMVFILPGNVDITGNCTKHLFQIFPVKNVILSQHAPLELADII